jgi:hypothetical protein
MFGLMEDFYGYAHGTTVISADPSALNNTMGFV